MIGFSNNALTHTQAAPPLPTLINGLSGDYLPWTLAPVLALAGLLL